MSRWISIIIVTIIAGSVWAVDFTGVGKASAAAACSGTNFETTGQSTLIPPPGAGNFTAIAHFVQVAGGAGIGGGSHPGNSNIGNNAQSLALNSVTTQNDRIKIVDDTFSTSNTTWLIRYGANYTNVKVNGTAYNSEDQIPLNGNLTYTHGGTDYEVCYEDLNGGERIRIYTPSAATTGPTESELITSQQSFFTQLTMNHQSYNVISGVGGNLDGLFNQNGIAPFVSLSGFQYQSYGAEKARQKRERDELAEKQPQALDILADQSKVRQERVAKRYDTSANLMAYASKKDDASGRTVEKLNAAAQEDIYGADLGVVADEVPQSPWNVWVKGSWTFFEDHDGSSFDGHMVDVVGGVDYRLSDDLIVGALVGYGIADFDTLNSGVAGSFEADGVHIGAYLGKRLAPNLLFDALIAYTSSNYDNRSGTTTGSFDGHRITVAAHLKGNIDWGMIVVQPTIGLMVASERQDAYRDSAAVVHAARTVTAGRLSIGPKFMFQAVETDNGSTQLWFAAKGEYDFSNQSTNANTSLPDLSDVASARLQAGFIAASHNGINLSLQGDLGGLGSNEFLSYGATAKVVVPF